MKVSDALVGDLRRSNQFLSSPNGRQFPPFMVWRDLDENAVIGFFLGFVGFAIFAFSSGGRPFTAGKRILLGIEALLRLFVVSGILRRDLRPRDLGALLAYFSSGCGSSRYGGGSWGRSFR